MDRKRRKSRRRRKRIEVRPGYCAFLVRKKQCKERAVEGEWLCEKHGSRCYGRRGKIKKSCRLRSRYILNRLYPKKSRRRTQKGGAWGPAPLAHPPHANYGAARPCIDNRNAINRIIRAINDCHPGGCPGQLPLAVPVQLPIANRRPPSPPGSPPPPGPQFQRNVRQRRGGRQRQTRGKNRRRTRKKRRRTRRR